MNTWLDLIPEPLAGYLNGFYDYVGIQVGNTFLRCIVTHDGIVVDSFEYDTGCNTPENKCVLDLYNSLTESLRV